MGDVAEDQVQLPLLRSTSDAIDEEPFERTGTIWTALAHIITGVIGAGVLSLAWSMAQLGWIAGPLCMIVFAAVTILTSNLLCDLYRFPDPESGPSRIRSYPHAVRFYLGEKSQRVCAIFAYESLYGCGITYTITTASSISEDGPREKILRCFPVVWAVPPVFGVLLVVSLVFLAWLVPCRF